MRDSNHSFPALNRACVSISSSLYDRRAIDSPVPTLPLCTSLQHLAYLTSTSPRIREILTLDGGLERLIAIVDTCLDIAYPERARVGRASARLQVQAERESDGPLSLSPSSKAKGKARAVEGLQERDNDTQEHVPVQRKPMVPFRAFSAYTNYPFALDSDESESDDEEEEEAEEERHLHPGDASMDDSSDPDVTFDAQPPRSSSRLSQRVASKRRPITRSSHKLNNMSSKSLVSRRKSSNKNELSPPSSTTESRALEAHAREVRLLSLQREFMHSFSNEYKDLPALVHTYGFALQCLVNVGVRGSEAIRTRVVESGVLAVVARILGGFLDYRGYEREKRAKIMNVHHPQPHPSINGTAASSAAASQPNEAGIAVSSRRAALRERERDVSARTGHSQFAYSNAQDLDVFDASAQGSSSSAPPTAMSHPIAAASTPLVAGMPAAPRAAYANAPATTARRTYTFDELLATAAMPPAQRHAILARSSTVLPAPVAAAPTPRASSASGSRSAARSNLTSTLLDPARENPTYALLSQDRHRSMQQQQQHHPLPRPVLAVAGGMAPRRALSAAPGVPLHMHGTVHLQPGSSPALSINRISTPDTIASLDETHDFSDANQDENESTTSSGQENEDTYENDAMMVVSEAEQHEQQQQLPAVRILPSNASSRAASRMGRAATATAADATRAARALVGDNSSSFLSSSATSVASSTSSTLDSAVLPAASASMIGDLTIKMDDDEPANAAEQPSSQSHRRSLSQSDEDANTASQSEGGDMEDVVMTGAADGRSSTNSNNPSILAPETRRSLRLLRQQMLAIAAEESTDTGASTSTSPVSRPQSSQRIQRDEEEHDNDEREVQESYARRTRQQSEASVGMDNETTPVSRPRPLRMTSMTAPTGSAEMDAGQATVTMRPAATSGHHHHHHHSHHQHSRTGPPSALQAPGRATLPPGVQPSPHVQLRLHPHLQDHRNYIPSAPDPNNPTASQLVLSCGPLMDHYVKEEDVLHCLHLLAYLSKYPHVRAVFHDPENELCGSASSQHELRASQSSSSGSRHGQDGVQDASTAVADQNSCCSCARKKLRCAAGAEIEDIAASSSRMAGTMSSGMDEGNTSPSSAARTVQATCQGQCHAHSDAYTVSHERSTSTGSQKHSHPCCSAENDEDEQAAAAAAAQEEAESLARARAMATMPAKDRKPALEPSRPPRSTANNVFSLVEQYTFRPSSPADRSMRLGADVQYWAGVIMRNACRKDELRGGIRQCANMGCGVWERFPREFAKCRRCRKAKYCSKGCQRRAWQAGHRYWCSARQDSPPAQAVGAGAAAAAAAAAAQAQEGNTEGGGRGDADEDNDDDEPTPHRAGGGGVHPHQQHQPRRGMADPPMQRLQAQNNMNNAVINVPTLNLPMNLEGVVDGITVGGQDEGNAFGVRLAGAQGPDELGLLDGL